MSELVKCPLGMQIGLPQVLRDVLEAPHIRKVGVGIHEDSARILESFDLQCRYALYMPRRMACYTRRGVRCTLRAVSAIPYSLQSGCLLCMPQYEAHTVSHIQHARYAPCVRYGMRFRCLLYVPQYHSTCHDVKPGRCGFRA